MQWKNVKLIYLREMRDQLRDRRTLFLIAVLPLLLYPLLGMSVFQLTQFLQTNAGRVLVLGGDELTDMEWLPPLVDGNKFHEKLFDLPDQRDGLRVVSADEFAAELRRRDRGGKALDSSADRAAIEAVARKELDSGELQAVLSIPEGFGNRLRDVRQALADRKTSEAVTFPEPAILFNSADDESKLAKNRLEKALTRWRSAIVERTLADGQVPAAAAQPFTLQEQDVSRPTIREAAAWAKLLPFVVFIWALTGAFYPAVDLCAGEKERGTLETLLTSPALRREIVWGKLLTVMTFSNATALLNLLSLGVTGKFVIDQLNSLPLNNGFPFLSLPPLGAILWLAVALVPMSALFSALCLALAAVAKSTKEGQYYLMPLMLVSMPLMMLPMSPSVELNLGTALAPLTGVILLLRNVLEGQGQQALPYVAPVVGVTLACCLLAIRWAEEQFNRESVLFRETERLELGRWMVHLVRDRGETPSVAQAAFCIAVILAMQFFASVALSGHGGPLTFPFIARSIFISQLACVFAPAAIMTIMLTRNPVRTLLLEHPPKLAHVAAAVSLALLLHGPYVRLLGGLQWLYPMRPEVAAQAEAMQAPLMSAPRFWQVFILMAVLPPLCEELAFRGFILSGFRRMGHKWWAIALSAIAFGAVHLFLQQKISAAAIGVVLGYLAVQSGSLWPGIVYHVMHNGLHIGVARSTSRLSEGDAALPFAGLVTGDNPLLYQTPVVVVCLVAAVGVLWALRGQPVDPTPEERVEEARHRHALPARGGVR